MSPPSAPGTGKPGFSDSDQAWFDQLAAHRGEPAGEAAQEAEALRDVFRQLDAELDADPAFQAANTPQAEQRSWERLQKSLGERWAAPGPAAVPGRGLRERMADRLAGWFRRPLLPGLVAVLLLVLALSPLWRADLPEPPLIMGPVPHLVERADATPRASAERLASELRALGLKPGLYQRGKTFIVDIDLEAERVPSAVPAFQRLGLTPQDGFTRIELSPR